MDYVLVIDDDPTIRSLLTDALSDCGYSAYSAPNGAVALELVRAHAPRLVLLDLQMPVMNGWEFARVYRDLAVEHGPVIVLTAAHQPQQSTAGLGATATISKPFDLEALLDLVDHHMGVRAA